MKKILVVVPSLNIRSGVTNHVINYYNVLKKDLKIDFAVLSNDDKTFRDEIKKDGNNVYNFGRYNFKKIKKFFKENHTSYSVIHCHVFNFGLPYLYYAKKYKIPTRIIHIHSLKYSENRVKCIINQLLINICKKLANCYCACSKEAGEKAFKNRNFYIINNGLQLKKYNYSQENREKVRKKLEIKNEQILFGMVGRLTKSKNQIYALQIFKILKESDKYQNSKFIIIGNGEYKNEIIEFIEKNNLINDVIMLENIKDIYNYYMAMDCFIFPSTHEGLGMVLIEAQAAGLPCYCTKTLPKEVFISSLIHGIALDKGPTYWAKQILKEEKSRKNVTNDIINNGFSIENESIKLKKIYCKED